MKKFFGGKGGGVEPTCFEERELTHHAFAADVIQHFANAVAHHPVSALQLCTKWAGSAGDCDMVSSISNRNACHCCQKYPGPSTSTSASASRCRDKYTARSGLRSAENARTCTIGGLAHSQMLVVLACAHRTSFLFLVVWGSAQRVSTDGQTIAHGSTYLHKLDGLPDAGCLLVGH